MAALGTLFSGLTLALLVGFTKRPSQTANLFLSLALGVIVLKTSGLSAALLPALGPLLFFYTRQLTRPQQRFQPTDWLHFCPLLVGYWIPLWPSLLSVIIYVYGSRRLIQEFYSRLRPVLMDRPRLAFRWLDNALFLLGCSCLVTLVRDPFVLTMAVVLIGLAGEVILKSDHLIKLTIPIPDRADAKEKGRRLKEAVVVNHLYEDAELTLTTLAGKLAIHPHELSRIINLGLEKNFSDFINECRVRAIARKMRDPAYDRLTLLGIAYESGFNSQRTFNRVFKEMTGKTPIDYKNSLKKEWPIDKMATSSRIRPVVLRSESPSHWAPGPLNRSAMFTNYLKIAFRNLTRQKVYSFINIGGLAMGMACALLISLWVRDELSYDRFLPNAESIHYVRVNFLDPATGEVFATNSVTPGPLQEVIAKDVPQVTAVTKLDYGPQYLIKVAGESTGQKAAKEKGHYATADFFGVFDLPTVAGNPKAALAQTNQIIITRKLAEKYFPGQSALGKTLQLNNDKFYVVGAVIEDLPKNSTLQFDWLVNWNLQQEDWMTKWGNNSFYTYVRLKPNTTPAQAEATMSSIYPRVAGKNFDTGRPTLQPITDLHLYADYEKGKPVGGRIEYVRIFALVAVFILLIACINFMNLATARSALRAREIGVRKVVGALRSSLMGQFMSESMLTSLLAIGLGIGLVWLVLPHFNAMFDKHLALSLTEPVLWGILIGLVIITGFLSGSYPALFLSSLQPIKILKGRLQVGAGSAQFRRTLVVFQFMLSIFLIVGILVVGRQMNYLRTKNLGLNRENILYIPLEGDLNGENKTENVRQEVMRLPSVVSATTTGDLPINIQSSSGDLEWPGMKVGQHISISPLLVGGDFIRTMNIKLLDGRDFRTGSLADSVSYIINEATAKQIGMSNPLGKELKFWRGKGHIVGVMKDFHLQSLHQAISPLILMYNPQWNSYLLVKTRAGQTQQAITDLEQLTKRFNPNYPFNYHFLDEDYEKLYRAEQQVNALVNYFGLLAILISCLGLFGLSAFTAEQRTKEIGVRKVLGASVSSIVALLSRDFLGLVLIALVLASPLAWWAVSKWLGTFAYRVPLSGWVFALAGMLAIGIALLTISYQSIKAALTNPVKSLQSE